MKKEEYEKNNGNDNIYRPKKLTTNDIKLGCEYLNQGNKTESRICIINEEFRQGFYFMRKYSKSVAFFGSARTKENEEIYRKCKNLSKRIVKDLGYAIVSGGGHGIMGAANRGAFEANGDSIGINIVIPKEQTLNPWVTDAIEFNHFYSRKVTLAYGSEVYIFFPGGFGTLDELFEILTLKQNNKIEDIPIILVGVEYWKDTDNFIKEKLLKEYKTISPEDIDLYTITDDEDEILEIIKNAPIRSEEI